MSRHELALLKRLKLCYQDKNAVLDQVEQLQSRVEALEESKSKLVSQLSTQHRLYEVIPPPPPPPPPRPAS